MARRPPQHSQSRPRLSALGRRPRRWRCAVSGVRTGAATSQAHRASAMPEGSTTAARLEAGVDRRRGRDVGSTVEVPMALGPIMATPTDVGLTALVPTEDLMAGEGGCEA